MEVSEEHWDNGQFQVEDLARRVGKSKSQLNRKLTSLTGYSPKELLRDFPAQEGFRAWRGLLSPVKMTFPNGASLDDPSGLFNSCLESSARRAIDFHEGDKVNEEALIALIRAAVKLNKSKFR